MHGNSDALEIITFYMINANLFISLSIVNTLKYVQLRHKVPSSITKGYFYRLPNWIRFIILKSSFSSVNEDFKNVKLSTIIGGLIISLIECIILPISLISQYQYYVSTSQSSLQVIIILISIITILLSSTGMYFIFCYLTLARNNTATDREI